MTTLKSLIRVSKSRKARAFALAASLFCAASTGWSHAATPRTPNVRVENAVQVDANRIVVSQKQTFQADFFQFVWGVLDENKDGKVSAAEKKAFPDKAKAFYNDYTSIRVNWNFPAPADLICTPADWPSKKPADFAKAKATISFTATYPYQPSLLDLIELVLPNLNAHQITCAFAFDKSFRALRASVGVIANDQSVTGMEQLDGHPDTFSVMATHQAR